MKRKNMSIQVVHQNFEQESREAGLSRSLIRENGVVSFFKNLFRVSPRLTFEDWENLEIRKSPQAIRDAARKEGLL